MDNQAYLGKVGSQAKSASYAIANLTAIQKQHLLKTIAASLTTNKNDIIAANKEDVAAAKTSGLSDAMVDRLLLDDSRLNAVISDIDNVIALADPVGTDIDSKLLANGLRLTRRRVPLGVIGVIYEARPNVTVDIAVLALKTGNAVILRGGKETIKSNIALSKSIRSALVAQGLPENAVQFIDNPDRTLVTGLLKLNQYVDMIVPRGGQTLQRLCAEQANIPVILGGIGICHMYVDSKADLCRVTDVITNAKVQRPTVCNALDTLLVHKDVALQLLPALCEHLTTQGVRFYGCPETQKITKNLNINMSSACDESFATEWLSLTLGIKVVDNMDDAIAHIRQFSSGHSEAILTDDIHAATDFMNAVDSAAVYVNASTRFTDGGEFGLGAEVAVSTQKLHARGPMGLEALTTFKWLGVGDYTARK